LDLDFIAHPTTGDVMKKKGVEAIKRSVRNLILTNFYDRPFVSRIGSNAQKLLFENGNLLTANFLKDAIVEVVSNFEPRVLLQDVLVEFDYDNNGYNASIQFIILNRNEPVVTSLFLERIR
jgi:phage baseplate assembly protein W